jgi:hypothetical protein
MIVETRTDLKEILKELLEEKIPKYEVPIKFSDFIKDIKSKIESNFYRAIEINTLNPKTILEIFVIEPEWLYYEEDVIDILNLVTEDIIVEYEIVDKRDVKIIFKISKPIKESIKTLEKNIENIKKSLDEIIVYHNY